MDENIPPYVLLCREFEKWKSSSLTSNTQQQANCIINVVVQQRLMEPQTPFGRASTPLRSQVRGENNNHTGEETTPTSTVLRERANIVGIVEDAGVDCGVFTTFFCFGLIPVLVRTNLR